VLVSPHRTQRPWQGRIEAACPATRPVYDPRCYLCPGNVRANGTRNPAYENTYAFLNDFPALLPDVPRSVVSDALLQATSVNGECRVLCFSPRHDLTLAQMSVAQVRSVVDLWAQQVRELGALWPWVQVFENKGATLTHTAKSGPAARYPTKP
jgi:UDPglucose--hexose-1-phosphate uridylyltransferase